MIVLDVIKQKGYTMLHVYISKPAQYIIWSRNLYIISIIYFQFKVTFIHQNSFILFLGFKQINRFKNIVHTLMQYAVDYYLK